MGGCVACARPGCFKKNKDQQETQDGKTYTEGKDIGMRINQAFKKYDKDHSGALSRDQTRQFLMDMFKQQKKPFTEEQVQKFIKAADKNHDGTIQKK